MFNLTIKLDKTTFPDFPSEKSLEHFSKITRSLNEKAQKCGIASSVFQEKLYALKRYAAKGNDIRREIKYRRDIRVLLHLWCTDRQFLEDVKVAPDVINHICAIRPQLGMLGLYSLTQLYFRHFDHCGDLECLIKFLSEQYRQFEARKLLSELAVIKKNAPLLFDKKSPQRIVEKAINEKSDLRVTMSELGVPLERDGRFQDLCKHIYYLESLRKLKFGESSDVFSELADRQIAESPYGAAAIGHEAIKILLDKTIIVKKVVPDKWLKFILLIAGDPRVPRSSHKYRFWWYQLDQKYINAVRCALSRFDLKLFLDALEEYRRRTNNDELRRMFPARKKFLEGLFDLELIGVSRLFIGSNAESFLNKNYDKRELPNFARLNERDKCIIYMQVGDMHMIEGSHSSYLWIYDELPEPDSILNYDQMNFETRKLGLGLMEKYKAKIQGSLFKREMPHQIKHTPNKYKWQKDAIQAFREHDVIINPEKVLSVEDYKQYKRIYGLY